MCFPIWLPGASTSNFTLEPAILKCSCRQGYEGDRCQIKSFEQDDSNSKCIVKCENNATCSQNSDTENGGKTICQCLPGFTGDRCEKCASNSVCQNGGQCAVQFGTCNCAPGFQGTLCQRNECDSYGPCLNGGTCIASNLEGPQCQCTPSFKGKFVSN